MMLVEVRLPTWKQCVEKKALGAAALTELESFILDNEPASTGDDVEWRRCVAAVLAEAINEDRRARGEKP